MTSLPNQSQTHILDCYNVTQKWEIFRIWEGRCDDTVDFKKVYVDMAGGDVMAGLLLSQIVYWFLPNKEGKMKVRMSKRGGEDNYWLYKGRSDWYDEVRLTPRQVDRAMRLLAARKLVRFEAGLFNGVKKHAIMLRWDTFFNIWAHDCPNWIDYIH